MMLNSYRFGQVPPIPFFSAGRRTYEWVSIFAADYDVGRIGKYDTIHRHSRTMSRAMSATRN